MIVSMQHKEINNAYINQTNRRAGASHTFCPCSSNHCNTETKTGNCNITNNPQKYKIISKITNL